MHAVSRHFTKTFIAGVVALLPIGGAVMAVVVAERTIADSWLARQPYYVPGLGLVAVIVITYAIGLTLTTLVGKFFWRLFDSMLEQLPALGMLYRTLKQVLGYGDGDDAMFQRVVLVPGRDLDSMEIGLVTNSLPPEPDHTEPRLVVFVPAAPTPTSGRVVVIEESRTKPLPTSVHDALKFIVAVGKLELDTTGPG